MTESLVEKEETGLVLDVDQLEQLKARSSRPEEENTSPALHVLTFFLPPSSPAILLVLGLLLLSSGFLLLVLAWAPREDHQQGPPKSLALGPFLCLPGPPDSLPGGTPVAGRQEDQGGPLHLPPGDKGEPPPLHSLPLQQLQHIQQPLPHPGGE